VHVLRFGEAQRAAYEPLALCPQMDRLALDFLGVLLAHLRLRGIAMPLVSSPAIGVQLREAKRGQQLWELQADVVLASSEPIRQDLARVMIHGVPEPTRLRLLRDIRPPSRRALRSVRAVAPVPRSG
jgi:hypothetical protein